MPVVVGNLVRLLAKIIFVLRFNFSLGSTKASPDTFSSLELE